MTHAPARLSDLTVAPVLRTERLRLCAPRVEDFGAWAAFFASDRSVFEGGPLEAPRAWEHWAAGIALWPLIGAGPFRVEDAQTGDYLGEVGIYQPLGFPETELGWFVVPGAEGRGIAFEAARAVRDWARDGLGLSRLVNYIDPNNARSIALGLRLGGERRNDLPTKDAGDVVILHDLTRVPEVTA